MQQVTLNVNNGRLGVQQVPAPLVQPGHVLIANECSIISAGTEKSTRELAQKSLLGKARSRPDHVRRVLEKIRNEGLWQTIQQVRTKLDEPMTMGYCSAGTVIACGQGVQQFKPGDLVASNGPHAELVCVPQHLCASVPDSVSADQAAFAVLGAIAMQGIRLSRVTLGETVFVIGLGLVGQVTVALLKSAGARVIGTDLDEKKCDLARSLGADHARAGVSASDIETLTGGLGADVVMITASTSSNGPVELAAGAVRQKGRVVAVGAVGMDLPRRPFYFKEAEFVVSCSYGPGRYDPAYEEGGQDYPAAYVRWTEQRNMQAVLDQLACGRVDFSPLISHRFGIDNATLAYDLIESGREPYLAIALDYESIDKAVLDRPIELKSQHSPAGKLKIGCIGAGNFARMVLLPKLCSMPQVEPKVICSASGQSAAHTAQKLGFAEACGSERDVVQSDKLDAVFVLTQHHLHARQVISALTAGKHVFTEKPLCLSVAELAEIEQTLIQLGEESPLLMVGFNRRFSPAALAVRRFCANLAEPLTISIRFNAGAIPIDHWIQDDHIGGGRIIGEACHGIDLATFLAGSVPTRVYAESIGGPHAPAITDDHSFITLRHANGSVSNIAYVAGGDKSYPKERVEVFGGGAVAVIDDFRSVVTCRGGKQSKIKFAGQDKGHSAELTAFVNAIMNRGHAPIDWSQIRSTTLASILAVQSLREGQPMDLPAGSTPIEIDGFRPPNQQAA